MDANGTKYQSLQELRAAYFAARNPEPPPEEAPHGPRELYPLFLARSQIVARMLSNWQVTRACPPAFALIGIPRGRSRQST